MSIQHVTLGWSEATVPLHTHACFYYTDEDSLRRSLEFLRAGLSSDDVLNVLFADASRQEQLLSWLQEGSAVDVQEAQESGRLAVVGGAPTRQELLANIAAVLDRGMERGNRLIRFLGFIAWGADGWPDEDDLLEFESQVNNAVSAYPAVIICTYGVPRLNGRELIEGGLLTHPVVFLNNQVLESNPLFVEPSSRGAQEVAGRG